MLNLRIKTIPHKSQRYETVGDWWWNKDGSLDIRVSDMKNWKYEFLVAFHELAEVMVCKFQGIPQSSVDEFDMQFEEDRERGIHGAEDEPGDDEESPYRMAHFWATSVERVMAALLGVNWNAYDKAVLKL